MNPQTADLIQTIVTLLPVAALIWRAAKMAGQIETLQKELQRLEARTEGEKHATDSVIVTLTAMLNDIKIAVTRIETKLEVRGDLQGKD